jgi:O-antigen/teichoic acid export membrane protein
MPATEITNVVSQVAFPTYSKLQDNLHRLRRTYLKVLQVTVHTSAPLGGWILVMAGDLTRLVLGEAWMAMVPAMQVLALAGLVRSLLATPGPMFKGLGRPDLQTKGQLARLCLLAVSICPLAIRWGIVGVSASVLLANALTAGWFSWIAIRISGCGVDRFLRATAPALLATLGMVFTANLLKVAVGPVNLLGFALLTVIAAVTYLLGALLLDRFSNYRLSALVEQWWTAARGDDSGGQRWMD